MNEIIQCVLLWSVFLLLLNTVSVRCTHVVCFTNLLFRYFCRVFQIGIYHNFSIHPPVYGHSGCFQFGASLKKAAWTALCMPFDGHVNSCLLSTRLGSEVPGRRTGVHLALEEYCQRVSQRDWINLHSAQQEETAPVVSYPHRCSIFVSLLHFGHSDQCIMLSCGL